MIDRDIARSRYGDLARQVREKREASRLDGSLYMNTHAHDCATLASDLEGLIQRARAIPGGILLWPLLMDAQSKAQQMAEEWEGRK